MQQGNESKKAQLQINNGVMKKDVRTGMVDV
jgi:hypothetical protein